MRSEIGYHFYDANCEMLPGPGAFLQLIAKPHTRMENETAKQRKLA